MAKVEASAEEGWHDSHSLWSCKNFVTELVLLFSPSVPVLVWQGIVPEDNFRLEVDPEGPPVAVLHILGAEPDVSGVVEV